MLAPKQEEAAVVLMDTQPPQLSAQATPQATIPAPQSVPEDKTPIRHEEQKQKPASHYAGPSQTQPMQRSWSPDQAKQAWRKNIQPAPEPVQTYEQNPQQAYQDGLMHNIIKGIPIEKDAVPLRQRVNAQWVKEGHDHFQQGVIKTICYELNKQKIMEASNNLPRKVVFKVVIERSGKLVDAQMIEKSFSPRFDEACLRAIYAAAPYRRAPTTVEGDPITLMFTLYHDRSQGPANGDIPTPITFYIN